MIERLHHGEEATAAEILALQIPAYKVEASLIGYDGIPHLNETVEMIKNSDEIFIGFLTEGELCGFLSYKDEDGSAFIQRLVVHPGHFHEGVASKLLTYFLQEESAGRTVLVTTGAKNEPARNLYKKFGFEELDTLLPEPGVELVLLEKKHQ
ncbi:GNAT family N-acetyltransferase [Domibacillus sp. 8LH]|jgi:ribosomal protein S18 acetylase RimI-like enzyme|uniref:GNAT family N-acetyltransferase n=1 Tax=Domibacillus TaxID=1433999 RepID=UPI00203DDB09|nr:MULTISPECIES: GNAT family N-acetyltransferase [Domibacillus]MCM3788686.1 GNAT family N-acetyltransferase [Domibacillus indicus]